MNKKKFSKLRDKEEDSVNLDYIDDIFNEKNGII